ncbi:ABC transporter permease [Flavicella marina]|uniref:ABC transporter permease n=1 Tax=Flavicella marina TaxID=1475951 RepID=UPI001264B1BA|nr:FtsX-like permease family protein [Flavicella marina]
MNFSLYIAKRYLFSKSSNNAINIITKIASIGIVVGTLALFLVLSVFSGLKTFSAKFLNATDPNIRITAAQGKAFYFNDSIQNTLLSTKGIEAFSKVIEERAFFKRGEKIQIAYLKGIDRNYTNVVRIDTLIYSGNWLNYSKKTAVVGSKIANKLSLGVLNYGDPLTVLVPKPGKGYVSNPSKAFQKINVQPTGIFSVSEELDQKFVFTSLTDAQLLLNYPSNKISALDIKTSESTEASAISSLKSALGESYKIQSRDELNAVFYKILNTEKLVAYLIFTLVLIIAIFNVIGSMIMMILDKKSNLTTLFNLGAPVDEIRKIFIYQGFLISVGGLFVGVGLGSLLILLQNKFHLFMITPTIAYPIEFRFTNFAIVCVTITLLGYFASIIASSRISKELLE